MTDKFRSTNPIDISYQNAEQPSSAKMSAQATQSKQGGNLLERAIGDIWGQSGDALLLDYPLQIANIARMIGSSKFLNPALAFNSPPEEIRNYESRLSFDRDNAYRRLYADGFPVPTLKAKEISDISL